MMNDVDNYDYDDDADRDVHSDRQQYRGWSAPQTATCILLLNNNNQPERTLAAPSTTAHQQHRLTFPTAAANHHQQQQQQQQKQQQRTTTLNPNGSITTAYSPSSTSSSSARSAGDFGGEHHQHDDDNDHHHHFQKQSQSKPVADHDAAASAYRDYQHDQQRSSSLTLSPSKPIEETTAAVAAKASSAVTASNARLIVGASQSLPFAPSSSSSAASSSTTSSSPVAPPLFTTTTQSTTSDATINSNSNSGTSDFTTTVCDRSRSVNGAPSSIADHTQKQPPQQARISSPHASHVVTIQITTQQPTTTAAASSLQQHPPASSHHHHQHGSCGSTTTTTSVERVESGGGQVTVVCFSNGVDTSAVVTNSGHRIVGTNSEMVVQKSTAKPTVTSDLAATDAAPASTHSAHHLNGHSNNNNTINGKSTYLYYMMASGQCSPSASSDTMDSGTCSDLETSPPPLPKKYNIKSSKTYNDGSASPASSSPSSVTAANSQQSPPSTLAGQPRSTLHIGGGGTFSDDSECSESSLSFDSLNSSNVVVTSALMKRIATTSASTPSAAIPVPPAMPEQSDYEHEDDDDDDADADEEDEEVEELADVTTRRLAQTQARRRFISTALPDSLLHDIRTLKRNATVEQHADEIAENADALREKPTIMGVTSKAAIETPTPTVATKSAAIDAPEVTIHTQHTSAMLASLRPTDQPAEKRIDIFANDAKSPAANYENDRFYTFHINERPKESGCGNVGESGDADSESVEASTLTEDDSCFAGIRELNRLGGGSLSGGGNGGGGGSGASTIRSAKGTVRGVKNRVRNGIATFLQMQQTNVKNYKEKDAGKVVLYTTSMGIVRQTFAKCANVKQILRTLLVKFEERDVFMSIDYQQEVRDRMQSADMLIPQLYVDGQHVGDADQVERLNESGELRQMLKPYKSTATIFTCQACGGYRLLPCPSCKGSKKSVHRNHFTTEFVALKCMNCDEVGLVKCYNC